MAACSSRIRVSKAVVLRKGSVSRDFLGKSFINLNNQLFNSVRKRGISCFGQKKSQLRVLSSLNSESESRFGVVDSTGIIENDKGIAFEGNNYVAKADNGSGLGVGGGVREGLIDGNGGNGKFPKGGGGGGGGGGNGGDGDYEEDEFGPLMKFEDVMRETEARGATLPSDMLEAAKSVGLRKVLLLRYLELQGSSWPLGFAMRSWSMLRNRMLADPSFLFKIGTEIVIDSCCATFAEVQKRGKDFWAEFELYAADLLVGVVVNVALVGMLAPYARIGQGSSASQGLFGRMQRAYGALPSSVFEAERPGCSFTVQQRIGTYFYKGILYGMVGFGCGLIGQGIANFIMTAKRNIKKSEEDIPVPPLIKSAALWGVFLAVSSNTRYQVINGLERLVEASPLAKQVPPVALAFTVGVRFANNIYGGMQFVDWARLSGVQFHPLIRIISSFIRLLLVRKPWEYPNLINLLMLFIDGKLNQVGRTVRDYLKRRELYKLAKSQKISLRAKAEIFSLTEPKLKFEWCK